MSQTVDAVFVDGVFKPVGPLSLYPNQRVRLTIEERPAEGQTDADREARRRLIEHMEGSTFKSDRPYPTREEAHERD